ncbi:putative transcriptional regulator [Alteromonadales bacterium TW-7]|nr:putative transcriptional regulator [Alteromonadales bacterium TW-7]
MSKLNFLKIIRRTEVLEKIGRSKSSLYNDIKEGLFVPPISIGARAVGFVESECEKVIQAMIAGYSKNQLKALVKEIVNNRGIKE